MVMLFLDYGVFFHLRQCKIFGEKRDSFFFSPVKGMNSLARFESVSWCFLTSEMIVSFFFMFIGHMTQIYLLSNKISHPASRM